MQYTTMYILTVAQIVATTSQILIVKVKSAWKQELGRTVCEDPQSPRFGYPEIESWNRETFN